MRVIFLIQLTYRPSSQSGR